MFVNYKYLNIFTGRIRTNSPPIGGTEIFICVDNQFIQIINLYKYLTIYT